MRGITSKPIDMIGGSPGKELVRFAVPIILGNLFQQFYNMVDSIVVGRFVGEEALASVGASYAVTNVFIAIAIGGGIGSSVIISQYLGAKQPEKVKTAVSTAIINFAVVGVLLSVIGCVLCKPILLALHTPENVLADAVTYLRIYFFGLTFLFLYNIMSSIFNALGNSTTPLKLLFCSSTLNIGLDLLFVVQFHMGVAGVAIATLIAQGISAAFSFLLLMRKMRSYTCGNCVVYSKDISVRMVRVAVPSIIQQSIVQIGILLVQSVVNGFGSSALAGYAAGMRFESICVVPMVAVGNAVSTFTAQNMGAKKPERVKCGYKAGLRTIAVMALFMGLIFQLFGRGLLSLFLVGGSGGMAFQTGLSYIHFESLFYVFLGAKACTDGVLRGSGDVAVFTLANLANLTIRVWFAHTFAPVLGVQAVWYAVPAGWFCNFLISFVWYQTGKWKNKRVI